MKRRRPLPDTPAGARAWSLHWAAACIRCAMMTPPGTLRRRQDVIRARQWLRQARVHSAAVLP